MKKKYPFYYEIRFKLLVSDDNNNIRTEKFTKKFKSEVPLSDRKDAFNAFQDYMSIIKENDCLIKDEFNNYTIRKPKLFYNNNNEIEENFNDEFYQEIGVYLIFEDPNLLDVLDYDGLVVYSHKLTEHEKNNWEIEKSIVYNKLRQKYKSEDPNFLDVDDIDDQDAILISEYMFGPQEIKHKNECLIHCVNSEETGQFWKEFEFKCALENEYKIYKHYKIDIENNCTQAFFWETKEYFNFLETPFYWRSEEIIIKSGENNEDEEIVEEEITKEHEWHLNRIKKGESKNVEFKYNMLKNYKNKIIIKEYIPKAICGFLNSKGGILYVGVDDNGNIIGIENELNENFGDKNQLDLLYRTFDTMLMYHFDSSIIPLIDLEIFEHNGKKILAVIVEESYKPIFMNNEWDTVNKINKTTFYQRLNASTRPINDVKDIVEFVFNKKWKVNSIN